VDTQLVNKRALESLVKSGAFDGVGDRATLLANLETALRWGAAQREQANLGQMGLFGVDEVAPPTRRGRPRRSTPWSCCGWRRRRSASTSRAIPMAQYPGLAESASCAVADVDAWWRARAPPTAGTPPRAWRWRGCSRTSSSGRPRRGA
jgi:DNA polymerase III subunit alpha